MLQSPKTKQIFPFPPRPFPPAKLKTKAFANVLRKANRTLKEYRTVLQCAPSPLFSHLLTWEAIESLDSQKIHIPLAKLLENPKKDRAAAQILDYMEALAWASRDIAHSPFSKKQTCRIHAIAKRATSPKVDLGRYRNRQNWIGPSDCTIEEAYFYPPHKKEVPEMMEQLFRYMKRKEKEPLLQIALAMAQLLIIHPFMDGNGRIARIWIPLFLYKKNLLPIPFFFLSGYFKKNRLQYFQTLFQTTEENNWENWIVFFLKGIIREARRLRRTILQIASVYARLPEMDPKSRELLFKYPVFTLSAWKKAHGSTELLQELKKSQLVKEQKKGVFRFLPLLKIYTRLR
ncbi:MAG: Fic family protein [Verrucomicrobia bacterium]|nr:Fic family protein [Verrucomicrobiota bacterium]